MNDKPKSHHAMVLATLHCTHPALDGADKTILTCLVENGDHGTGENCRPGNYNLMDAVRLTKRALQPRINKLIAAGLIDRTEIGDGRGRATIYRILWKSEYYPDKTPSGKEWLIDKPGSPDSPDSKQGSVDSPDSPETGQPDRTNRAAAVAEPGSTETETGQSGLPHTCMSTQNPPSNLPGGRLDGWIHKNIDQMGVPNKSIKEILDGKVRAKGDENVVRALDKFLTRPKGFKGLDNPWAKCLTEIDEYLLSVHTENSAADQKAKEEVNIQASITRQIEQNQEGWQNGPQRSEENIDDFWGEQ
jgi:hypothetical protein